MKVERQMEPLNDDVLLAMAEMGLDKELTLQVAPWGPPGAAGGGGLALNEREDDCLSLCLPVLTDRCLRSLQCNLQLAL